MHDKDHLKYGRRSDDLPWFCKVPQLRWIKRIWPVILIVGGFAWNVTWNWYQNVPSSDKKKQYDEGLKLIPEFYAMQSKVAALEHKLDENYALSQSERAEIKSEIRDLKSEIHSLGQNLQSWFQKAGGGDK